jgi:starch synthase (maltosyl-transferring)
MGGRSKASPVGGLRRVIIEGVEPEIDGGQFPIKRTIGEPVVVEADIFTDGHDTICAYLLYKYERQRTWTEVEMEPQPNDRWRASFEVDRLGTYLYTLLAFHDPIKTWRRDLMKRVQADQDVSVDLLIGAQLFDAAAARANDTNSKELIEWAKLLRSDAPQNIRAEQILSTRASALDCTYADRENATYYEKELAVTVDRERARFSTWYEMFPRSVSPIPGRHGTFTDVEKHLPYVANMGFDVLYLPPIHPIGTTYRKGRNNALTAGPNDVGSPWAIGAGDGGHKAIHSELGSFEDFHQLVARASKYGVEIALDIAFQASPDHPYVKEHPEWFRHRPDGSIQYAENPPKKYQDIYPFDFGSNDWWGLWQELKSIVDFWTLHGVRIFRVDNPHTKPLRFWEWLIPYVRRTYPEVIFLSEAFTRPRMMYRLAKIGFTQSYTYFAWRNLKWEIEQYFTELTQTDVVEYFRPNLWPNTPDILTEFLQTGGRQAFMMRYILAATLAASCGIYGPAFELLEHTPREPKSEEYLDSEKYHIRDWDFADPASLSEFIGRINAIRKDNIALQYDRTLRFHRIENEQIIAYTKYYDEPANLILVVVNLDMQKTQSGWLELPLRELGIAGDTPFEVHDLLADARYTWSGAWNYVELNPHVVPAHIFSIERDPRVAHEQPVPIDT